MKDFRTLNVWQRACGLALDVYQHTAGFPVEERFGLTSQIRRSAVSVPSNIAEGCGRDGDREFARFLQVAMGSASEMECHSQTPRSRTCFRASKKSNACSPDSSNASAAIPDRPTPTDR